MTTELYFSNWRELNSHLIWVYQGRPVRSRGRFDIKQLSAWLITRGSLFIGGEEPQRIDAGNWVFAMHKDVKREFSEDAEILSIKFDLIWPDGRMMFEHSTVMCVSAIDYPELGRAARSLLRYAERCKLTDGNLMQFQTLTFREFVRINQLFQSWLLEYVDLMESVGRPPRHSRREDVRVIKLRQFIDAHPLSIRLSLDNLASRIGLSFGHADTLFHETFGQTMRGYFDQRRYSAALHWLDKTNMPIKEIAYELGFNDATALTHWFRKKAGVAPSAYRKSQR